MADENNQGQSASQSDNSGADRRSRTLADGTDADKPVPYSRVQEVLNEKGQVQRENKELTRRLTEIESKLQEEEEERAKKRGEWESYANKQKAQAEKEKQARVAAENKLARYQRLTTWRQAARGIILDEALDHAFDDLSEDDFANIDETDEVGMSRLAEMVADRHPYMADGPRGAGSGFGSRTPVLERPSKAQPTSNAKHKPIFKKRNKRPWK